MCTYDKVLNEIRCLKSHKASGNDISIADLVREISKKAVIAITEIFNAILKLNPFQPSGNLPK